MVTKQRNPVTNANARNPSIRTVSFRSENADSRQTAETTPRNAVRKSMANPRGKSKQANGSLRLSASVARKSRIYG